VEGDRGRGEGERRRRPCEREGRGERGRRTPAVPTESPPQRGAPAEVAARNREGRDTPKSEGRREEDEKCFAPMGRYEKIIWGKKPGERYDWLRGN
jgi:hypothetical protein